jgi:ribonuclease P/MRP protein subunit RPP1
MIFYEYHVHPEIDLEGMLAKLEALGWTGVCFVCKSMEAIEQLKKALNALKSSKLDFALGYKIETTQPEHLAKIAKNMRKKVEVLLVHGGNLEINRAACETPEVDILTHPELGRNDAGLDYVAAKLARENKVAIEFNFRSLLLSYKKSRADIFSRMLENAKLVRKAKAPFIITSGAVEPYDLRSPYELMAFGKALGLNPKESKNGLSERILKENRKRLGGKWVMPGVEIE